MARVTFTIGNEVTMSEWRDTKTTRYLLEALPSTAPVPLQAKSEPGDECRAASSVNIVGRVTNPEVLPRLKGRTVVVALAD